MTTRMFRWLWSYWISDVQLVDRRQECERQKRSGPLYTVQYIKYLRICGVIFEKVVILKNLDSHTEAVEFYGEIRSGLNMLHGYPLPVGVR